MCADTAVRTCRVRLNSRAADMMRDDATRAPGALLRTPATRKIANARLCTPAFLAIVIAMFAPRAFSQTVQVPGAPPQFEIHRLTSPPVIDGNVTAAEWQGAARVDKWWEFSPGDNIEPKVRTVAYLGYDDRFLYVAFVNYDPDPHAIRAPYADRDNIDDTIDYNVILLNPSNDHKTGVEFIATPRGVQGDAINSDVTGEDAAPDFYWDSAGRITDEGWTVEMRIPFTSLRYSPGKDQTWPVLLFRNYPRDRRYQIASQPVPRGANCTICLFPPMIGLHDLPSSSHLVVAPYTTVTHNAAPTGGLGTPLGGGSVDWQGGADAKWTPNAHLALDATLNPDFSQVESDVAAVTANQRFAVFFPEKRPFFLEGKDLFGTPIQAVYTREINSPRWGGRATGTAGDTAYTVLVADDRGGGSVIIPGPNHSSFADLDLSSRNLIARARHDLGSSFASLLVTDREIEGGAHNRVLGPDFLWRAGEHDNVQGQLLLSDSLTPDRPDLAAEWDGRRLRSHAGQLQWSHSASLLDWTLILFDRGNDFRADLGFVPQVGTRESFGQGGITFHPRGFFSRVRPFVEGDYTGQRDGALVYRFIAPGVEADGRWTSYMSVSYSLDRIRAGAQTIKRQQTHFDLRASPTRIIQRVELQGQVGSDIDFDNSRPGRGGQLQGEAEVRPTDHLVLEYNGQYNWLTLRSSERLFTARVQRLKATYNFSARSFLRVIGQTVHTDRDAGLYLNSVDSRDGSRTLSALYAYKLNWQTVLYLGYGDLRELTLFNGYAPSARQAFVKVSYAWQR